MATEEQHAVAVLAQINAGRPSGATWQAWDLDDLNELVSKPGNYVEVTVSRRPTDGGTIAVAARIDAWRIDTRVVGESVTNVRGIRTHIRNQLENVVLTIGGLATTPIQFETAEEILPDDQQFYGGSTSWTYTH